MELALQQIRRTKTTGQYKRSLQRRDQIQGEILRLLFVLAEQAKLRCCPVQVGLQQASRYGGRLAVLFVEFLRQTPVRAAIASERVFTLTLGCKQPQQTLAWIRMAVQLREQ